MVVILSFEEDFYKIQSDLLPEFESIIERDGKQYEVTSVDIFNENFTIKDDMNSEETLDIADFADFKVIEPGKKNSFEPHCDGDCPVKNMQEESEKSE